MKSGDITNQTFLSKDECLTPRFITVTITLNITLILERLRLIDVYGRPVTANGKLQFAFAVTGLP